jgi:hypothetical protein
MGFPPEATESDDPAGLDGGDAPTDDADAPRSIESEPITHSSDLHNPQSAPAAEFNSPAAPQPGAQLAPPLAAMQDFPVASVLPPAAALLHSPPLSPLEERLIRLEAELSQLRTASPAVPGQQVQTRSPDVARKSAAFWSDVGKRLMTPSGPAAAPPRHEGMASLIPPGIRRTWMLLDALTELRAMYCMFFDPRYRLSWIGRLAPVVLLALIFSSWLWMPFAGILGFGWLVVKIGDVVLAFVLFKLLSYEARRYRETAPDLPPSLRQ